MTGASVLVAFATVAAMFFASTIYSQRRADTIDDAAESIAMNATPSIETLALSRGTLRQFEFSLGEAAQAPANVDASHAMRIQREREEVDRALALYLATPAYPGERALWRDVRNGLSDLDSIVSRLRDAASSNSTVVPPSEAEIRAAFDHLDDSLEEVIAFNAERAHTLASRIERTRRAEGRTALVLDALSAALALLTAVILVVFIRRSQFAIASHRHEAELRANELDAFAGRVAHDVKGPVSAALLWIETIRARASDPPEVTEPIQRVESSLRRAIDLVDALLAFARSGARPNKSDAASIARAFDDVRDELESTARRAGVELVVEPTDELLHVACAPSVVGDVLGNLVRNAVKYMRESAERRVTLRAIDRGTTVRIEVKDTGPGMSPATAAACFEPFRRGEGVTEPGTGLGLATVRRLVEAHAGEVRVFTREGEGATFVVDLPRARQSRQRNDAAMMS